jgi:hypothetical protein
MWMIDPAKQTWLAPGLRRRRAGISSGNTGPMLVFVIVGKAIPFIPEPPQE